ncbi:MAG: hypothetical protein CL815_04480 [Coraliomargarita sp.]|nr:hypothetical protein [Coraliomargarita sp.]|tara:strand:- start:6035 stop:6514 length:480 start_codon:yes stop_codon:yes gene_type:complete
MTGKQSIESISRNRHGFSLIEVVIAVALFAAASVVLTSAFVNALLAREHGQNNSLRTDDISAVRLQLLLEANRDDAEDGGDLETLHSGLATWRCSIEESQIVDLFKVLFEIKFSDPIEGTNKNYQESLYLLRPTWSESDQRSDLLANKRRDLLNSRDFE